MVLLSFFCNNNNLYILRVFILLFCNFTGPNHGKLVVCYIGTWAVYRPMRGSFSIEHIDPSLCTHVVYAFVGLNTTHDAIRSLGKYL